MHPDRVGPYLIERKIGAGGMGTVYYGRHEQTGEEAAIKVLPASLAREEGFIARFGREIDAMKKMANPHIVRLAESGVDGETYFYSMEYIDGETLTARLRRDRRIDWRETIDIAMQLCSALKAAHDTGVVHRDLKPSNILLAEDGTVKLTDFGVAQVFAGTKLTATGGIIGTAEFMSPEQAQGRRTNKKSDLYSLGAVMYVMLTGRPPFSGKTTLEVIHKHRYGRFDRPRMIVPDTPHWLDEIVCQLLEKDPDKRVADAYVLSKKLQEVLSKVELSTRDSSTDGSNYDGSAPTIALDAEEGPGGGTLMRDLLRAEVEYANKPSPFRELLNNTWVLVGMLAFLVGGGFLWFRNPPLTSEQKFQKGVAIMQELAEMERPDRILWRTARDEYFLPLLDEDPDGWEESVGPYLDTIRLYEIESGATRRGFSAKRTVPSNDAERFFKIALHYRDIGDDAAARRKLSALIALLEGQPGHEEILRRANEVLSELDAEDSDGANRHALLDEAMKQAEEFSTNGDWQAARRIWSGVIEWYGPYPDLQDQVEHARTRLREEISLHP
jgi:serine/threonine-protein kinase